MPDSELRQQRRGTNRLFLWGAIVALLIFAGGLVWSSLPGQKLGTPEGYRPDRTASTGKANGERTTQGSGQSTVGRASSNSEEDSTGKKARAIESSAAPTNIDETERAEIRSYLSQHNVPRTDSVEYTISVGASVPKQAELRPLPADLASILHGFQGQQFVVIRDQLIIVDTKARRIVAVIPGVA